MNKKIVGGLAAAVILVGGGTVLMKSKSSSPVTIVGNAVPETFVGQRVASVGSDEVVTQLTATLTKTDKDGKPKNYAAESIKLTDNNKKLEVKIKKDLKWQNGDKLTSKDYLYGIKMLANKVTKSPYAGFATDYIKGAQDYFDGKSKEIEGVKVKSDTEFTIELSKPSVYFDKLFCSTTFAPENEKWVKSHGGMAKYGTKAMDILSSGEMQIKSSKTDDNVVLVRKEKEDALSKAAKVDSFKIKWYKESNSAVLDYKAGKLNSIGKSKTSDKILGKKQEDKADISKNTDSSFFLIANGSTVEPKLAKALYKSLDKEYINKTFFYGSNKVRNVISPSSYDVEKSHKEPNKNDFDMSEAKKLAESFKGKKLVYSDRSSQKPTVVEMRKYMFAQWKKLGINVELKLLPSKVFVGELMKKSTEPRKWDVSFSGWSPDYPEASTFYNSLLGKGAGGTSYSNWNSDEYNKEIKSAIASTSSSEASKHYAKAEEIQRKDGILQAMFLTKVNAYVKKGGYNTLTGSKLSVPSQWEKMD